MIQIREADVFEVHLQTRMPFRYGIATMTELPHVFLRVRLEVDGKIWTGISADHLPPKWFTKDPSMHPDHEIAEMIEVIGHAVGAATHLRGATMFDLWRQLYDAQAAWGRSRGLPPLLTNFGVTLVERAAIEAFARSSGASFGKLLRSDALGIDLGNMHPLLAGSLPAEWLPPEPLREVVARHTVGLSDPLSDADIREDEHLDDGLPESLESCIRRYGLVHFKIKVNGEIGRDRERLAKMARIIEAQAPPDFRFSLDGNEQFHSVEAFCEFWERLWEGPDLNRFRGHLLFVEQPFHRDVALGDPIAGLQSRWSRPAPIVIDESDAELASLPRALALGYAGTSHKNCKGVFKGVANRCLIEQRQRAAPGETLMMSGEDLVNIGPVALLQDLAVQASLGIRSVERNGHHYFAGLSMFPDEVQHAVLVAHPDLYEVTPAGWPALRVAKGLLNLGSVIAAPFGAGFELRVEQFTPVPLP